MPLMKRICVVIAGAGICAFVALIAQADDPAHRFGVPAQTAKEEHRAEWPTGKGSMSTLPNVSDIAARVTPSVAHISVSGSMNVSIASVTGATACESDNDASEPQNVTILKKRLQQFQKKFGIIPPLVKVPIEFEGSGVIVREDGIIMTNAHVVEDAEAISVKLSNRREYRAKLVGVDPLTDVAILKIDAKDLPVAKLAQDPLREPGDWVVAIGSPFGLAHSVTAGIVSATARFASGEYFVPFIQSDVSVSPGSSGGPLVNMRGEVIGINSAFMGDGNIFQGVSFAIPIDLAWKIGQKILREGRVRHGQLGITVQDLSEPLAKSFKLDNPSGALVVDVAGGSTAERAGLKIGDVILTANGMAIDASGEIGAALIMAIPGQTITLGVWHRGAMQKMRVPLGDADRENMQPSTSQREIAGIGLVVSPLGPGDQLGLNNGIGVLVKSATGAAQHAGMRTGDILLALNATPIKKLQDAEKIVASTGGYLAALIQQGGEKRYVPIYLEK